MRKRNEALLSECVDSRDPHFTLLYPAPAVCHPHYTAMSTRPRVWLPSAFHQSLVIRLFNKTSNSLSSPLHHYLSLGSMSGLLRVSTSELLVFRRIDETPAPCLALFGSLLLNLRSSLATTQHRGRFVLILPSSRGRDFLNLFRVNTHPDGLCLEASRLVSWQRSLSVACILHGEFSPFIDDLILTWQSEPIKCISNSLRTVWGIAGYK